MKRTLRVALVLSFTVAALAVFSSSAQAQKVDVAFGVSAMDAPGASQGFSGNYTPVSLTGGAYPGFSFDVQAFHHLGVGAEVFWRASQATSDVIGFNYRPLFWNVNAVYAPKLASHTYLELVGGIGALSTRYYTGPNCSGGIYCTNYTSSNHFDGDFGGGIKFYPVGGFFIRPEARIYLINNNTDFSSYHATRYGVSIGYTFGQH